MNIKETRDYFMAEKKVKKPVYFSTGITLLDLAVGGSESRGLPAGTIVNLTGDPQTGKSLICTESVAKNKSLYKDFPGTMMMPRMATASMQKNYMALIYSMTRH